MSGRITECLRSLGEGPRVHEPTCLPPVQTQAQHLFVDLQISTYLHLCLSPTRRSSLLGPRASSSPEARASFTIIEFNPFFFQMENLRPREGKQFVAGHAELVTDNGLELTALPGSLLLFLSFSASYPPLSYSSNCSFPRTTWS